jgi:hypothetical protein
MIYSPREQQRFLRREFQRTLDEHERLIAEYDGDDRERYVQICGFLVAYRLEQHSLELKHESFRDEVEWRLIRTVTSHYKREPVPSFSARGHYIKPYIEIAVGAGATALPIAKVICGPRLTAT